VSYGHTVVGGGITVAAYGNVLQGSASYKLTRAWSSDFNFGFSHNDPLKGIAPTTGATDSVFGGLQLARTVSASLALFFRYSVTHQDIDGVICTAGVCASNFLRHTFGVGFGWTPRPIRLE
jgi:hypothetical protein